MAPARVLVVDEKERVLQLLERLLSRSFDVSASADGDRALSLLVRQPFDVVLVDLRLPGARGFEILRATKARQPATEVLVSAPASASEEASRAIRMGAFAWLEKPFDLDAAARLVGRAVERRRLCGDGLAARGEPGATHNLVGHGPRMQELHRLLARASDLDVNVLIEGEPGTGKELAARAIHYHSHRREGRFVACGCSTLDPEGDAHCPDLFRAASGGTLFLDEVAALPLPLQETLLRLLRADAVRRADGGSGSQAEVRVVATTCLDLNEEVRAGRFREPLHQLLRGFPLRMPALRERIEDLPELAGRFLEDVARSLRREIGGFEPEALRALSAYSWPGNVRELENAIAQAASACPGSSIEPKDLPPAILAALAATAPAGQALAALPYREAMERAQERASREYLVALLTEFRGNVSRAAMRAGMERESLHRLLKRFSIRSDDFKKSG
jgi:two-component system response regulator AtoC